MHTIPVLGEISLEVQRDHVGQVCHAFHDRSYLTADHFPPIRANQIGAAILLGGTSSVRDGNQNLVAFLGEVDDPVTEQDVSGVQLFCLCAPYWL